MVEDIIDAHAHIASHRFIPHQFIEGAVTNVVAALEARGVRPKPTQLYDGYLSTLQDHLGDELQQMMQQSGIAKTIILLPDFTYVFRDSPLTIEEMYLEHKTILTRHPDSYCVFGGIDPRWGKDGLDLFERSVRDMGFSGLKLYPPCGFEPSDEMVFPFYEICRAYQVPVLVHIGPTSPALSFRQSTPLHLDCAAKTFTDVNFIIGHGATHCVEESVLQCAYRPNVYLDISGLQSRLSDGIDSQHYLSIFQRGINHKILFGSDWPVLNMQGPPGQFVSELIGEEGRIANLPWRDLELIFRENALRVLNGKTSPQVKTAEAEV
jgi:uncharacterized protein